MLLIFSFIIALFASFVALPLLMRLAWRLQLVDAPGERKVHASAVPRCGGLAIVGAALVPVFMWAPMDDALAGYIASALVVVAFGVIDDFRGMNAWSKFFGQGIAVAVALSAGIVFEVLPFFGMDPAPPWATYPVTALFLLGVTNAFNLFDGLDGLAGGCAALSLLAVGVLAAQGDGFGYALIAAAVIGGIFGFLRFNTHPANVFMGDAGSQFLGFTVAVLSVLVIGRADPALNPALPLLLLGVPVVDTLMVMTVRLAEGRSPFSGDRNHVHHKLLDVGCAHYEAVAVVYVIQASMIAAAFVLRYASDLAVVGAFAAFAVAVLAPLVWLRRVRRRGPPPPPGAPTAERRNLWLRRQTWLAPTSVAAVRYGIVGFMICGAFAPLPYDQGFGLAVAGVGVLIVAAGLVRPLSSATVTRVAAYGAAVLVGYLLVRWSLVSAPVAWAVALYLTALCAALGVALRVSRRDLFRVTPQDLLVLMFAIAVPNLAGDVLSGQPIVKVALVLIILFYASEFAIVRDDRARWTIAPAAFLSLGS
ncbi:MAG: undecaprenyl/decaprenyl-phosphate alpha-N-acetylglucosaminyl 1-phosphate transferase [Rhodospirillales bacterium]|nr:undecaprenyl/decaprenyl-phosphate alpha-N-acetylglucosaminyl 1-phosphate transferase [Rhodospirillales bacterium]